MNAVQVPVAEADLESLIRRVAAGEHVVFTQDGEVVAELRRPVTPRHTSSESGEALRRLLELRDSMPPLPSGMSSVDLLDEMYEKREEAIWPSTSTRAP